MRPASTTEVCTAPPARKRIVGAPWMPARGVVAVIAQHGVARDDQRDEVRAGGAGDESDPAVSGQPEDLQQPARRDLLDGRRRRGGLARPGVLVPRGDEPVGGQRRRVRAADDEAVEARGAHRHEARAGGCRQLIDHLVGRESPPRAGSGRAARACRRHPASGRMGRSSTESSHSIACRCAASNAGPYSSAARRLGRSPCRWSSRHLRGSDPPARRRHPQGPSPAERLRRGRA